MTDLEIRPTGSFRLLSPADKESYLDHLYRLEPEAQRLRFAGAVSQAYIADYACRALLPPSVVVGYFVDGTLRGTGELQPAAPGNCEMAEAAFAVERPYRGKGIGTELMRCIIVEAQRRGISTIFTTCQVENLRMRQLAEKYNAKLRIEHNEVAAYVPARDAALTAATRV
jgi:GNAT superfamily N-acetyltransferase